jgi:hypothetical protein
MLLFAFNGGEWEFGSRITYSFAPDGTNVGGIASNLNQALASRGFTSQTWQTQFRKAAAIWQSVANINLVEVSDTGAPFGISGKQQNDARFGDIRIAGLALGTGTLGLAFSPPPINGGTLAGDIVLNSSALWNVNSNYDLMTVALHEIGHSLGLDHTAIGNAVMFATYTAVKQSLQSDDINGVRGIYSARTPDTFEGPRTNDVYNYSTILSPYADSKGQIRISGLDISTATDNDWFYAVAPPTTTGTLTVTVQSSGLSSLSPRLLVHSSTLATLGQASSNDFGATISVSISGVSPGQGFFFRVLANPGGGAATGAYGLLANFGNQPVEPIAAPDTTVNERADQGGGYSLTKTRGNSGDETLPFELGSLTGFADALMLPGFDFHNEDVVAHETSNSTQFSQWDTSHWQFLVAWLNTEAGNTDASSTAKRFRGKLVDRALAAIRND